PVRRRPDEFDALEQAEQRAEALAHDALVVGEQDADHAGSHSWTRKPSSVGSAQRRPPSNSARSRIPVSPDPPPFGAAGQRVTGASGPWSWTTSVVPSSA